MLTGNPCCIAWPRSQAQYWWEFHRRLKQLCMVVYDVLVLHVHRWNRRGYYSRDNRLRSLQNGRYVWALAWQRVHDDGTSIHVVLRINLHSLYVPCRKSNLAACKKTSWGFWQCMCDICQTCETKVVVFSCKLWRKQLVSFGISRLKWKGEFFSVSTMFWPGFMPVNWCASVHHSFSEHGWP